MSENARQSVIKPPVPGLSGKTYWSRLYGSAKALALTHLMQQTEQLLVVITANSVQAENLVREVSVFNTDTEMYPILTLPDWETLPYDLFSPYQDIISERLQTLFRLPKQKAGLLVVPVTTLMHRLMPVDYLANHSMMLEVGETLVLDAFRKQLTEQGYQFVDQVSEHGEVSIRGSLLDVFPMGAKKPFRIDLFDEEIDSIRTLRFNIKRSNAIYFFIKRSNAIHFVSICLMKK